MTFCSMMSVCELLNRNVFMSEDILDHFTCLQLNLLPLHSELTAAYLNIGIILMNQGHLEEAKRTFLTCADIPDENLKDPHAHKSSVTSCLYNLGKLLHEQGQQEVSVSGLWEKGPANIWRSREVFVLYLSFHNMNKQRRTKIIFVMLSIRTLSVPLVI